MLSFALLLAHVAAAGPIPAHPADGEDEPPSAAVVVHRQPSVPVVALRLSILASDPPGYAGAGHLIQHLRYPRLRDLAARVGGHAEVRRSADAIVYEVTGPASELDYLADLLKSTLEAPTGSADAVSLAERELRDERLAEWETAPAHARSILRAQLFPSEISVTGTDRSSTRFSSAALPTMWAEMYAPDRVSVVAVGDVYLDDVQRAFAELPDPPGVAPFPIERDSVFLGSLAPAQATRAWLGRAYVASDLDPAAVSIAVRLLGDEIRARVPSAEVSAEHWWTHDGQAAVLIAASSESAMAPTTRALDAAVGTLLQTLTPRQVEDAADEARREMLFYTRTPDRMAEVIGEFVDREGDPDATERYFFALQEVDEESVREVLARFDERVPARVELPPQPLP